MIFWEDILGGYLKTPRSHPLKNYPPFAEVGGQTLPVPQGNWIVPLSLHFKEGGQQGDWHPQFYSSAPSVDSSEIESPAYASFTPPQPARNATPGCYPVSVQEATHFYFTRHQSEKSPNPAGVQIRVTWCQVDYLLDNGDNSWQPLVFIKRTCFSTLTRARLSCLWKCAGIPECQLFITEL